MNINNPQSVALPDQRQQRTYQSDFSKSPHTRAKPKPPVEEAITSWFSNLPPDLVEQTTSIITHLLSTAPKRWIVYPPMLLLPSGSFEDEQWRRLQLGGQELDSLWEKILELVGKREGKGKLTHLAINNGIPLLKVGEDKGENLLRNPTGLRILYGDFGPSLDHEAVPSREDLEKAFWVSTKQNGIIQIWAPRYTMFSRGNIKEKARILNFHKTEQQRRSRDASELMEDTAVDLYAGIGYFVFSYVKMGIGRVIGFELNPWSVEGLKRGALANGFSIQIVKSGQSWVPGEETITIFEEDNAEAPRRLSEQSPSFLASIRHINCGLLPSSQGSWEIALGLLTTTGWLHLHENVGVNDIELRRGTIRNELTRILSAKDVEVDVEHVELVKTFAPDVYHCVYDVYINRQ
ncbi:S-adenosyl-L-methionine-dependent methyltransferase [Glarea lozoyensis ATCC 20868]|uniref:tRNA wybutosine-synthesizing protein 2 n=1 Tax=Glarea lozoyensis (strain ATCC 20868 / MF5171) TaxID=1116229 RepID=S3DGA3_GLAL2|nr:S-adenosyl-L-methionine-dependent methyltransferase [Glarea lozoyensis ATCC 20868]EPE25643.1 S-adenosyl-L-methionine-dependent methyltransferase [Glarea lozoyensis ATCC 20868]